MKVQRSVNGRSRLEQLKMEIQGTVHSFDKVENIRVQTETVSYC